MDNSKVLNVTLIDENKIRNVSVDSGMTVEQIFYESGIKGTGCRGAECRYQGNPVVGVFRNGVCQPLSVKEDMCSELKPIRAFDPYGRRIYRHSLCYILFYAAKCVIPERHLIIGHSLGDGFWFSFSDGKDVPEKDVALISDKMHEVCRENREIEYKVMPSDSVRTWFGINGAKGTLKYLDSINSPETAVFSMDGYLDLSFEPIVSRTSVLSLFELRPYKGGILLRYPVSGSVKEIVPFRDNSRIFEAFRESRNWENMLHVTGAGDLSEKFFSGGIPEYVRLSEALHRHRIASIAERIYEKKSKAVFICGPSSSGKTTFARRLCELLRVIDCNPVQISLDEYYKPRAECPVDSFGKPDLECIEAIRTDMFRSNIRDLLGGKDVVLPHYDFGTQETTFPGKAIRLNERTIFVIEGIHALNPVIYGECRESDIFRIYISPLTQLNMDDHNRVSSTDCRILRRVIRDYRTRNSSAAGTLNMWASVERGERKYIFPFQNNADEVFNSALDYEIGVIATYAVPLLMGVHKSDGDAYPIARRLLAFLSGIHPVDSVYVPSDSLLREFIGRSDYD